jgi:hemerythrin-like metal-binding protein
MSQIKWDESFSVNNAEIDSQHKKWIDIFNRLDRIMLEGDYDSQKETKTEVLQSMLDYARYHFKFEEEHMRKMAYPGIVEHVRTHKNFDTRIYQSFRECRDGNIVLNTKLLNMIKNWLLDHILVEDKKYSQFTSDH